MRWATVLGLILLLTAAAVADVGGKDSPDSTTQGSGVSKSKKAPKITPAMKRQMMEQKDWENEHQLLTQPLSIPAPSGYAEVNLARAKACSPTLFRVDEVVTKDIKRQFRWQALSAQDVLKHTLVTLPSTVFAKVPETSFSNVDGRISHPVLGAMGGDAGEFILGLHVFQTLYKTELTSFQVATLFSDFLAAVPKTIFSLQTDNSALLSLCRTLRFCYPSGRLDAPSPDMIPILRTALTKPQNMGCGHIKHLLMFPERFGVSVSLIESFTIAFYNLLWGVPVNSLDPAAMALLRGKLRLQVLKGPHTEGAIVKVRTDKCASGFTPMLIPELGKVSLGLLHVDAVRTQRTHTATFLTQRAQIMGIDQQAQGIDAASFAAEMERVGDAMLQQAVLMDNGQTPLYELIYPGECCGA